MVTLMDVNRYGRFYRTYDEYAAKEFATKFDGRVERKFLVFWIVL